MELKVITIIIFFMFLTWDVDVVTGGSELCIGGEISDGGTYASYVAHVLAELAAVAPTRPDRQDVTTFPDNGSDSVVGLASCYGTTDASVCASCLTILQQALFDSCRNRAGGGAQDSNNICDMGFRMVG